MTISRSEAERVLQPHLCAIAECIYSAVSEFHNGHNSEPHWSPRTQASMIHDLMVKNVKSRFDAAQNVKWFVRRGLFCLEIDGALWLRFKKLDRNRRASSIPTRQALSFLNVLQLELPGMPCALSRLTAGYVPNALGTGIDGAYVTYPLGSEIGWFIELTEPPSHKVIEMGVGEREAGRLVSRVRAKEGKCAKPGSAGSTRDQSEAIRQRRNGHGREGVTGHNSG